MIRRGAKAGTDSVGRALLGVIAAYRAVVSPWLPARCRFHPSCSAYAAEAIAAHGPVAGVRLAASRVARCHPWHAGGYDPVPVVASAQRRARGPDVGTHPVAGETPHR